MNNDIKYVVLKQIRFSYLKELINILKRLEEQKFNDANVYEKFLYEYKQIEQLWEEIKNM